MMSRPTLFRSMLDHSGPAASLRSILRRRRWTEVAIILSIISMTVELSTHICAATLTDPLPDWTWVLAYAFLTAMLYWNEKLLSPRRIPKILVPPAERSTLLSGADETSPSGVTLPAALQPGPRWPLAISLLGSGVALCVAVVFTVLFLPFLPISIPSVLLLGLGVCCWSPLINLALMIGQWRRVTAAWDARMGGAPWKSRAVSLTVGIAAITLLVGRPILIGYLVEQALLVKRPNGNTIASLRLVGGGPVLAQLCWGRRPASVWLKAGRSLARYRNSSAATNEDESLFDGYYDPYSPPTLAQDARNDDRHGRARKLSYLLTTRPYETIDTR